MHETIREGLSVCADYTGLWKLLCDWQTLLAGGAAIFGGLAAYFAGVKQATATREATADATKSMLERSRLVERAYISGGGPTALVDGKRVFVLTAENAGKTPATLTDYSVYLCDRSKLPSEPKYLDHRHTPETYIARIPPDHRTREITRCSVTDGPNPIAYGRFRYTDIWDKPHFFASFCPSIPQTITPLSET